MKLVKSPFRLLTVATLAIALTAPMMISDAHADWRGGRGYYRGGHGHHDNTGAYVALGLGAAALGGLLAYQATQPSVVYEAPPAYYAPPPPAYYPPATYYAPAPGYYTYSHPADAPYERPREWGN